MQNEKTGIVLLNLGGPETLRDVAPFLFNLFSDREIIRLGPPFLQRPLAWLIARKRAPKSRAIYARIGGGSPLARITLQQERALQQALASTGDFRVVTAMRYSQPRAACALQKLEREGVTTLIALPLYPHYSRATTGSSLLDLRCAIAVSSAPFHLVDIPSWPDHPAYVDCLIQKIRQGLARFPDGEAQIVYSAHSLPASFIEQGDPYVEHLQRTIGKIEERTGRKGLLCFQSKSGPARWLAPSTPETLERLARSGCRNILMVPISFVSDHVETLYEIHMLYKQAAGDLGMRLEATDSFNADPAFIACLKDIVIQKMKEIRGGSPASAR